MKIKWFGHACFSLTTDAGTVLLTDPFDASVGYAMPRCAADIVTESHQHHDHNDISSLPRVGRVLRDPCDITIDDMHISTLSCFHDDVGGAKRGNNLIFLIEADGLRIAHCGDLGHLLSDEQIAALGRIDVLLVPVGGYYTIDAPLAEALRKAIAPRLTIPMHYLTPALNFPIADETAFLALNGGTHAETNEIAVCAAHWDDLPEVLALAYA